MSFISISEGTFELGWRHSLAEDAMTSIAGFVDWEEFAAQRLSKRRIVSLPDFEISETCLKLKSLMELDQDQFTATETLTDYCDAVDRVLKQFGTRLPTEDELEAAMACHLFPWGDELPSGSPYGNETMFKGHFKPSITGLIYDADTYKTELTRSALKLGDGGEALCGGYPWPMAWLALSPAYRIDSNELSDDVLYEFMQDAEIRQVRL